MVLGYASAKVEWLLLRALRPAGVLHRRDPDLAKGRRWAGRRVGEEVGHRLGPICRGIGWSSRDGRRCGGTARRLPRPRCPGTGPPETRSSRRRSPEGGASRSRYPALRTPRSRSPKTGGPGSRCLTFRTPRSRFFETVSGSRSPEGRRGGCVGRRCGRRAAAWRNSGARGEHGMAHGTPCRPGGNLCSAVLAATHRDSVSRQFLGHRWHFLSGVGTVTGGVGSPRAWWRALTGARSHPGRTPEHTTWPADRPACEQVRHLGRLQHLDGLDEPRKEGDGVASGREGQGRPGPPLCERPRDSATGSTAGMRLGRARNGSVE